MSTIEKIIWVMGFFHAYGERRDFEDIQCAYSATKKLENFQKIRSKLSEVVDGAHINANTVEYRTLKVLNEIFGEE